MTIHTSSSSPWKAKFNTRKRTQLQDWVTKKDMEHQTISMNMTIVMEEYYIQEYLLSGMLSLCSIIPGTSPSIS